MKIRNEQPDLPFDEELESEKPVGNGFIDKPYKINPGLTPRSDAEKSITADKMEIAGKTGERLAQEFLRNLGYSIERGSNGNPDFVDKDSGVYFEIKTASSQRPFDIPRAQFDRFIETLVNNGETVFYVFISYRNRRLNSGSWPKESSGVSSEAYENFVIEGVQSVVLVDARLLLTFSNGRNRNRDMDVGEKTIYIPRAWLSLRESDGEMDVSVESSAVSNPSYLGDMGNREVEVVFMSPKKADVVADSSPF